MIMKKAFFLLLFSCLAGLLVGQNLTVRDDMQSSEFIKIRLADPAENAVYHHVGTLDSALSIYVVPDVGTDYVLVSETYGMVTPGILNGNYNDLVWRPVSEYTIFDSGLNLEVFEREVQIRFQIYEIAAEAAIAGDAETEGIAWFIVEQMKDAGFERWYNYTLPAMLEMLSIPESTTLEDVATAEKVQRLKKRLFPARE